MNRPYTLFAMLLLLIAPFSGLAQTDDCPALAQLAFTEMGTNCSGLGRNSACYGFNRVDATFSDAVADDFFTQPTDRTELTNLQTIETAPFDETLAQWGVAVMSVQANVPNALPGQALLFMMVGGVEVTNAVPPDQAALPGEPLGIQTSQRARIRSGPGTNRNAVGGEEAGTWLQADARSADGAWFRILYGGGPAWVGRDVISVTPEADALPVVGEETRTPMQAFYVRTQVGRVACDDVSDSMLVVQGPKSMTVNFTANETNIAIGSTITLTTPSEDMMELMVLDGEATLNGVVVPEGFKVTIPIGEGDANTTPTPTATSTAQATETSEGLENCQEMTADDLQAIQALGNIPWQLLNYPIEMPDRREPDCRKPGEPPRNPEPTEAPISVPVGVTCGNNQCEAGEAGTCPGDCPNAVCQNGVCEPGEDAFNCDVDCGFCGNGACNSGQGENENTCPADCDAPEVLPISTPEPVAPVCGDLICDDSEICECFSDCVCGT